MADEEVVIGGEQAVPEPELTPLSPVEQDAYDQGWKPKDEFKGNPEEWRPAKDWLERGSLFKKIDSQNRELTQLKEAVGGIYQNWNAAQAANYERARQYMIAERRQALKSGDLDAVANIEERIDNIDAQAQAAQPRQQQNGQIPLSQEFKSFVDRNGWYTKNDEMKDFADYYGVSLAKRMMGRMTEPELLKAVEDKVKEQYPDFFKRRNTGPASPDSSGTQGRTSAGGASKTTTYADREKALGEFEKNIYDNLIKGGVKKEVYWRDYDKVKGR